MADHDDPKYAPTWYGPSQTPNYSQKQPLFCDLSECLFWDYIQCPVSWQMALQNRLRGSYVFHDRIGLGIGDRRCLLRAAVGWRVGDGIGTTGCLLDRVWRHARRGGGTKLTQRFLDRHKIVAMVVLSACFRSRTDHHGNCRLVEN